MPTPHYLPIPTSLRTLACDTVSRRVASVPFIRNRVRVTGDLIAAGIESLNAEATRTLAINQRTGADGRVQVDGLDRLLTGRGFPEPGTADTLSLVLKDAGIVEPVVVSDRRSHRTFRGIRLLSVWTWHIASETERSYGLQGIHSTSLCDPSVWTNLCPVCQTGTLNPVTGQRLFGIPETDFLACTHCGAKFVPSGDQFRLVSIATIRDPSWKRHLNKTRTTGDWAAIASGSASRQEMPHSRTVLAAGKKADEPGPAPFSRMKDGTLGVALKNQTYYFRGVHLHFGHGIVRNLFAKATAPVRQIISLPPYNDIRPVVKTRYAPYLDSMIGSFLFELKQNHDGFYREFLNVHGDGEYCRFRTTDHGLSEQKGIWLVVVGDHICAAGGCHGRFADTINETLGSILPATCYRDGDATSCRINALICRNRKDAGIYFHTMTGKKKISQLVREMTCLFHL